VTGQMHHSFSGEARLTQSPNARRKRPRIETLEVTTVLANACKGWSKPGQAPGTVGSL